MTWFSEFDEEELEFKGYKDSKHGIDIPLDYDDVSGELEEIFYDRDENPNFNSREDEDDIWLERDLDGLCLDDEDFVDEGPLEVIEDVYLDDDDLIDFPLEDIEGVDFGDMDLFDEDLVEDFVSESVHRRR